MNSITVGSKVNYHSYIGGSVTSTGHTVLSISLAPNSFGCDVAWITGKTGCVAVAALSLEGSVIVQQPKQAPLTGRQAKSKARYMRFIEYGECFDNFRQFLSWDSDPERSWNGGQA